MSAHVFRNEIAQHIDSGMDAFIGKPVSPERLEEVLSDLLLHGRRGQVVSPSKGDSQDGGMTIDQASLESDFRALGTERTARMIDAFRETAPERVSQLSEAIEKRDWLQIAHLSHSLKGSAGSLGLVALEQGSRVLESAARRENITETVAAHERYEALFDEALKALLMAWEGLSGSRLSANQDKKALSAAKT